MQKELHPDIKRLLLELDIQNLLMNLDLEHDALQLDLQEKMVHEFTEDLEVYFSRFQPLQSIVGFQNLDCSFGNWKD